MTAEAERTPFFVRRIQPSLLGGLILWLLETMVVAIRQALDYCSARRSILVCALASPLAVFR